MRAVILIWLIGCGDGPGNRAIRGEPTLETFERRMCACTNADCAAAVIRDMKRWSEHLQAPRADSAATAAVMARYNACLTAATRKR